MIRSRACRMGVGAIALLSLAGCGGQVAVPPISAADDKPTRPQGEAAGLEAIAPALTSNGTEPMEIPEPDPKLKLPRRGDPFLYGLTVTGPVEAFYRAVDSKRWDETLKVLDGIERSTTDDLPLFLVSWHRARALIAASRYDDAAATLDMLSRREQKAFGRDLETSAFRGELHLWRENVKEARSHYGRVLTAIGRWRVPTFYLSFPSNVNEISYFGRAQLRAQIGLVLILIREGDYGKALAWAVDAEKRSSEILGVTKHVVYGRAFKATPDLYTAHGWCLAVLAGARTGHSKNPAASEAVFEKAKAHFAIENLHDGAGIISGIRESVLARVGPGSSSPLPR